ncbi:MAG TPA: nucleotidyltransferase domain-containing protein [Polyangiaceae bacterium]|nr:nucleotidyltransferase domain-containing protein [Polyangiaceae bacterium]
MLREHFDGIVDELGRASERVFGESLISVAVFGSVARGTMRHDSDIDLFVVARDLPAGRLARVAAFEPVEQHVDALVEAAHRDGVHTRISPVLRTPDEVEHGSPLLLDMTREVRILIDRGGFLRDRLDRLHARLTALGAQRIRKKGGYYWLLQPDLKPGEDIQL